MKTTPVTASMYLSPTETAHMLSVSRQTVYRLCSRGVLPSVRVGGQVRIPVAELTHALVNTTCEQAAS
jgi:excisionase family DNA binding protein